MVCWVLDRPSHRVLLPQVQALRCPERLRVMGVLWVALVVVVVLRLVVVAPRLELLGGLEDRRHPAHQRNPVRLTCQIKQVDERAIERGKVDEPVV